MRPVISVSLDGRAYQLEDDAHAALAEYLDSAARALTGNPDQAEILADLEQAIADKCERFLNPHKTVVGRGEIEQVIREMGPVDSGARSDTRGNAVPPDAQAQAGSAAGPGTGAAGQSASTATKRLYQISDGALISGICKGLAVYLDIDVTLVRLLFVLAAIVTGGLAVLVYIVMMFIVPYANTPEELAAARGLPFNARVLVEQAKLKAAQLADAATHAAMHSHSREARAQWKAEWRKMHAQWRYERRRNRAQWRAYRWTGVPPGPLPPPAAPPPPLPPLAHFISGLIWAALGLVAALVTLGWLLALFSLVTTGAVFGWIPLHLPLWAAIIGLVLIYQAVVWPLRAVRHGIVPRFYGYSYPWHAFWDALLGLLILAVIVWYFTHHGHDLQQTFDSLQRNMQPAWHQFLLAWQTLTHGVGAMH
jgi:phage shock protein PspC (stress-responsive transcriptional regulator)